MSRKLVLLLLSAALVAGCGQGSNGGDEGGGGQAGNAAFPVTVTDGLGREVKIDERPAEIGSMAPSATETVFAVGAGDRVEGVSTADDYPRQVEKVEKIGDYKGTNAEKVASLGIDVLFLSDYTGTKGEVEDLETKTGADVVVLNPPTVEAAIESLGTVGKVTGNESKAEREEKDLRSELEGITSRVEGEGKPSVFYELSYDPLFTVGPGSFVEDTIELAGGKNAAADAEGLFPQYPVEKVVENDPDYYLVGDGSGSTVADVEERAPYRSLSAVEDGKVYVVEDDLLSRPGPRIVDGVRLVAEKIHPDAF